MGYIFRLGTLWSGNCLVVSMLCDQIASRKSKMAASKPEVITSHLVGELVTKFQRLTPFVSGVQQLNASSLNAVRPNRKSEAEDSGLQTGSTYISACRWDMNEIPMATPCFGVQQLNASSQNAVRPNRKPEIQLSSRHLGIPTSGLCRTSFILFHWLVGPLKHGCSRWNFDSISSTSLDISTSGLGPPSWISDFRSGGTAFSLLQLSCWTPKTWG